MKIAEILKKVENTDLQKSKTLSIILQNIQKIKKSDTYTDHGDQIRLMENARPDYISNSEFLHYYISSKHNAIFNMIELNFIHHEIRYKSLKKHNNITLHHNEKIFNILEKKLNYSVFSYNDTTTASTPQGTIIYKHNNMPMYLVLDYEYKNIDSKQYLKFPKIYLCFYPSIDDNETNDRTIENIVNIINSITSTILIENDKDEVCNINIITRGVDGFNLLQKQIEKDIVFEEIDLHYGEGFEEKYYQLIKNINDNKKGLVLFHGLPGTGKTYCIEHLLSKLENKIAIYVTADIVDHFTDPEFIDFLLYEADIFKKLDENLFFIIEDSERLVMRRDSNYVSAGISNLLNTTDGILNGMLNIQAILTFNTDIANVDDAILRSERLLGQFEFGPIKGDRIKKLSNYLKIKELPDDFHKGNNVIADIYALNKKRSTIKFSTNKETETKDFII